MYGWSTKKELKLLRGKVITFTASQSVCFSLQLLGRQRTEESGPSCWVGVKVFGNELSVFTCEDLHSQINQASLSMAGLAVKLLKV